MTAEEVFSALYDKYGVDFNWHLLPLLQANGNFVEELKREIGNDHFLYHKKIWAVAKCDSNDIYAMKKFIEQSFVENYM